MNNRGVSYTLIKNGEEIIFDKGKEVEEYLGCDYTVFYNAYKKRGEYKGYKIIRNGDTYHRESHKTRLWKIWSAMKERCYRVKHINYKSYGGRGIKVCDAWKKDYTAFRTWALSNGYEEHLTLDRIDVNGNYEPSNCRWITTNEQAKNKRNNRVLEYKGEKYILSDLAKKAGIGKTTLRERLSSGWSVEDAVEKPVRPRGNIPWKKLAEDNGVSVNKAKKRYKKGYPLEIALSKQDIRKLPIKSSTN